MSKVTNTVRTAAELAQQGHTTLVSIAGQTEKNLEAFAVAIAAMNTGDNPAWKLVTFEGQAKPRSFGAYLKLVTDGKPLLSNAIDKQAFAKALIEAGVTSARDIESASGVAKSAANRMARRMSGEKVEHGGTGERTKKLTDTEKLIAAFTALGPVSKLDTATFNAIANAIAKPMIAESRRRVAVAEKAKTAKTEAPAA